jgi:hypothetical protein
MNERAFQHFCKHIHILRRLEAFSLAEIVRHVAVRQFLWHHVRVSATTRVIFLHRHFP